MRKYLKFLILILAISSCNQKFEKEIEISEQFKLDFLNKILSDTIDIRILKSKDQLISNIPLLAPPIYISLNEPNPYPLEGFNHVKFISDTLKIYDTLFVKSQFKSNKKLKLEKLDEFGFRIYDMESVIDKQKELGYYSIEEEIDSLNRGRNSYGILSISKPIFNKELNLAYLRIANRSNGHTIIIENENGKWKVKNTFGEWVE